MFNIKTTVKRSFCLGCGLCEAIGKQDNVTMRLETNGFYEPRVIGHVSSQTLKQLGKTCPGINIECIDNRYTFCGNLISAYEGWSNEPSIRKQGSSGGVITALALYLLRTKQITAVLHVGPCKDNILHNELRVSRTETDIISCASSRYAPALIFNRLPYYLSQERETYLFIGKPCDIMALKKYLKIHPEYCNRVKICISLMCAGIPSYNATLKLIEDAKNASKPLDIKYRGDGWPGNFKVKFENGEVYTRSYNDSWGRVLGRNIHFRCKICPDGIGQWADIVVGDAWQTSDGYPDFNERDGKSFILARTSSGNMLLNEAYKKGAITLNTADINSLKTIQPYQYLRLRSVFYRLLPALLVSGCRLKIKGLYIPTFSFLEGCKISLGTIYRYYKRKK